jgi:hypothetical protein
MNRRAFLKVAGTSLAAVVLPGGWFSPRQRLAGWPALLPEALPKKVQEILGKTRRVEISSAGNSFLCDALGKSQGNLPLRCTQWNQEKSTKFDRLLVEYPWGIVLHWYGEPERFDKTVTGYLRGFDGLRKAGDYTTRTSAHFLVGGALPVPQAQAQEDAIGILQTQAADRDGTPYVASHLRTLDYKLHRERGQYFVRALDALQYADPRVHSILQDFYDGPKIDPGWRTIAIEITGYKFDDPATAPTAQLVANVVSLVWAVMKRYKISALDILGHQELELDKPDPGKRFMATIRYLLGVKALVEDDEQMKELVFGRLLAEGADPAEAVWRYFKFVRDYLVLISSPAQVYPWEASSGYWFLWDSLPGAEKRPGVAAPFRSPLPVKAALLGDTFLEPASHEGVDLYPAREQNSRKESGTTEVLLAAEGECLAVGKNRGCCAGEQVIFRHRQPDGAEVLTIYSHLSELRSLQTGQLYPQGTVLGKIASPQIFMERYLHFAVAYGAAWETDLCQRPDLPLNAKPEWIRERYLEPQGFLKGSD